MDCCEICPLARWSHLLVILLLIIIQKVNGTDPVHGFVVPRVICHVIHQALQGSAAGQIIRAWFLKNTQQRICISGSHARNKTLRYNYRAARRSEYFGRLKSIWLL